MKKILTVMTLSLSLLASASVYTGQPMAAEANENSQTITRSGSQASTKGSSEYFTGNVRIDPLFSENDSAPYSVGYVTFQPGARSAWHTHPTGQRLIVTKGVGWTQEWGGPIEEIRAGDVVWCPPGVKHWHGASPTKAMTHIALTGVSDGKNVEWMEKVTNEQYGMKGENKATNARQVKNENKVLNARQEEMVTIAAFTASGDLPQLENALNEGLDAGLTINEIKEILVQMYAYAGFPRSLNGINTFMEVVEEREAKGITDEVGKEASPLPANKSSIELGTEIQTSLVGAPVTGPTYTFVPVIDQFLKGHLFGDIFGRDNLDFQSRELATIAALANMEGVNSQLAAHFNIGFNTGLTEADMRGLISVLEVEVGKKEAKNAEETLNKMLSNRAE
ncbi:carboxymuconolactone decarboxylase family protein [Bacillus sp. ISL-34]|uniref:(R)-mandelonitrile lyase n=1 Tax=Bacillus sp. ISL-34 TaxID=2819121 RepID=UPI001BE578FE|nr:carboxymuconolactone decarboxylase family protein [Bacillus sp. ISL-34]MBT2649854.1 carboxymuconolactone decarboxylase family protein [Bacillus sp. ISL-34]